MIDLEFEPFSKIARLSRDMIVTEKIDGTNAQIYITDDFRVRAGSRNTWIFPGKTDNFGFAAWVETNLQDLLTLGPGRHYGEWWGSRIQRGYGLTNGEKRFSLFNVHRWADDSIRPKCCSVVPVLYTGNFDTHIIQLELDLLALNGSKAAPGFMKPEGVVIYHTASKQLFKKTILKDAEPKSLVGGIS